MTTTQGTAIAILDDGRQLSLATTRYADWAAFSETVRVLYGPVAGKVVRLWVFFGAVVSEFTAAGMREAFGMQSEP